MFGFLFCVDAGLFAVAIWRRQPMLHVLGAMATLVVFVAWTNTSYGNGASRVLRLPGHSRLRQPVRRLLPRGRAGRPPRPRRLEGPGRLAVYVAPMLLFVFPTVAAADAGAASAALPFTVLFALLAACAAFAVLEGEGIVYFIGAFWAVTAEASWSAHFLTGERLPQLAIYGVFGLLFLGVPLAARRWRQALRPEWLGGVLLLVSVALLFFLSAETVAPESLWGLAFLLAVLNVALTIEGRAARLRWLSIGGGALSWLVLGSWWIGGALTAQIVPA